MTSSWTVSEFEPTPEQIEAAARWRLRLRSDASVETASAYMEWLKISPAHEFAAAEVETFDLVATEALCGQGPAAPAPAREKRQRPALGPAQFRRLAAAVLVAVCAIFLLAYDDHISNLTADAVTYAGEQEDVQLADGSRLQLNTKTSIDVSMTDSARQVRIRQGEVFFDVAKGDPRPFLIEAGDARIRVVGTQFIVHKLPDRVQVTVVKGIVSLAAEAAPDSTISLVANTQGFVEGGQVQRQVNPDIEVATAWRDGHIVFYGAPLGEVMAELSRYRDAPIWISSNSLRAREVSGVFLTGDIEGALRTIEKSLGVKATRLPGGTLMFF